MSGIEKSFSLKLSIQCQTLSRYHSFPKEVPAAVALYLEENNILMLWRVICDPASWVGFSQVLLFLKAWLVTPALQACFPCGPQRDRRTEGHMYSPVRCNIRGTRAFKKNPYYTASPLCLTLGGGSVVSMAMIPGNNAGQSSRDWGWKLCG